MYINTDIKKTYRINRIIVALALATVFDNRPSSTWSDTYQTHPEPVDDAPSSSVHDGVFLVVILVQRGTTRWLYWDRAKQRAGYTGTEMMNGSAELGWTV